MKICVYGLWHQGAVAAACLADAGFEVRGVDPSAVTAEALSRGKVPVFEPGLENLIKKGLRSGRLSFSPDLKDALKGADLLWGAFDTPVGSGDRPDGGSVERKLRDAFRLLKPGQAVMISSHLPVGTARRLDRLARRGRNPLCCVPENLRLGSALRDFMRPARIVAGTRDGRPAPRVEKVLGRLKAPIRWVGFESAEMAKHGLNAYLASSVAFANELARLCEATGADFREVEGALRSDPRIGRGAYLSGGLAFSGGTLGRDLRCLSDTARRAESGPSLWDGIRNSNRRHSDWLARRLLGRLFSARGKVIAFLGLTYKPGTDTLRRSGPLALARRLAAAGAEIRAFDPRLGVAEKIRGVRLCSSWREAARGADAVVVAKNDGAFLGISPAALRGAMRRPLVFDPARFLEETLGGASGVEYLSFGRGKGR